MYFVNEPSAVILMENCYVLLLVSQLTYTQMYDLYMKAIQNMF